jgi:hypothetical protein
MKLEVSVEESRLNVRIEVENAQVREAIKNDLAELGRTLRELESEPSELDVSDYQSGRRETNQNPHGGAHRQSGHSANEYVDISDLQNEEIETQTWSLFDREGTLDCLI